MGIFVSNVTMVIKLISVGLMATAALINNATVYFMVADVPVVAMITRTGESVLLRASHIAYFATNEFLPLSRQFNRTFSE
jgi:hypothetical protein